MIGLGQGVSFLGTLLHWNYSADPYSSFKYFLIATMVFAWSLCNKPRRGLLSVVSTVYMYVLTLVSIIAWNQRCFIGAHLNYFTGVFPSFIVFACYHYSIGDKWEKIANSFIAACLIVSVMSILQGYGHFLPQGDYFNGRAYAAIGSPVFLSGLLAMSIPLCLGRGKWFYAIPLIAYAILLTQSRSGVLAAIVGVLGYYFAQAIIGIRGFAILSTIALVLTVGMFSTIRNTSASDKGRYQMARMAVLSIAEHPLVGIGPERFGWIIKTHRDKEFDGSLSKTFNNAYAHNHILEALTSGGIVLFLAHIMLMATTGLFVYRTSNYQVFGSAIAMCAFGLMQPTPLLLKCVLASILGALDRSENQYHKASFKIVAAMAFCAALSTVVMAKIYKTAADVGLAQMAVDAYQYQPSAVNEGGD